MPATGVGATSESDLLQAVRFAARHGWPGAVESAADQIASAADGGLLTAGEGGSMPGEQGRLLEWAVMEAGLKHL
ncbi:hypothetical protein ABZS88_37000 [Streptomyces sp. NPDC005480]|uniref:hypothetical protein n=1 Tax=Streptomyces sp. NPDC005480 TaxID=3154880 RepID=UPI0033BA068A